MKMRRKMRTKRQGWFGSFFFFFWGGGWGFWGFLGFVFFFFLRSGFIESFDLKQ